MSFFRHRAKLVRVQIAKELGLDGDAALKLSFSMSSKDAWYLGPRPRLDAQTMLDAVAGSPGKFIELMLLKELIESSALDAQDTFVGGGFGPGVYLGSASQASKNTCSWRRRSTRSTRSTDSCFVMSPPSGFHAKPPRPPRRRQLPDWPAPARASSLA